MKNKILTLLIVFFIFKINITTAQPFNQHAKRIDSLITIASDKYDFNGVILVAEEGKIIYEKAVGYSNYLTKEKITTNSIFSLASISKAFTAMGIMLLKEKGELDYENNILKYFPSLPYKGITIRQLLNHTSGLPDYERLLNRNWDRKIIADNNDVLEMLKVHQPKVSFSPGEKYEYCNTGYVLLALIIEKVSKISFHDYLQNNIFQKLNMERTKVINRRLRPEVITDLAYNHVFSIADGGYTLPDSVDKFKYVYYLDGIVGDGGVNSTVENMLKWDQALYTEELVSAETLEEAFKPPSLNGESKTDYGFGWHINNTPNGKRIEHGGGYAGYINKFVRMVDKNQSVIMLTNNSFQYYNIHNSIIDILNNKSFELPKLNFDFEIRKKLLSNNMNELNSIIEMMLADSLHYQTNENTINLLGYDLLNINRIEDAIEVLKINVRIYPKSANVYDSLGEAYMKKEKYKLAVENYEYSLKLDSGNRNAEEMLKQLREMFNQ